MPAGRAQGAARPEPTIELGLLPAAGLDPGRPGPERARSGRARSGRSRRWLAGLLVVLMVGTIAGAAVPSPALALLWTVSEPAGDLYSTVAVGEQDLYVATGPPDPVLTAYRLADGAVRWQVPLGITGDDWVGPDGAEGVTVRVLSATPMVTLPSGRTTAYDPGTGRPRWTRYGRPWQETGENLVLVGSPAGGGRRLTLVGWGTGQTTAVVRLGEDEPAFEVWESPRGAVQLFTLRTDGLLTRYDLASGAVVTAVRTPHRDYEGNLWLVDGLLVVADQYAAAYDAVTLAPRWTVPDGRSAEPCGPVVCVAVADGLDDWLETEVAGIDPGTGAARWSVRCRGGAFGGLRCGVSGSPLGPGDRLWVSQWAPDGDARAVSWIVDAATGEPLTDPTEWALAAEVAGAGLLLARREAELGAEAGRIWWAWSGADLSAIEVLGATEARACTPYNAYPYLVCWTDDGTGEARIAIWRINR